MKGLNALLKGKTYLKNIYGKNQKIDEFLNKFK